MVLGSNSQSRVKSHDFLPRSTVAGEIWFEQFPERPERPHTAGPGSLLPGSPDAPLTSEPARCPGPRGANRLPDQSRDARTQIPPTRLLANATTVLILSRVASDRHDWQD